MRFLVAGSGGREHALCWKLAQEVEVFAALGNPGIAEVCECFETKAGDAEGLAVLAKRLAVDCVLIGPEDPLIAGTADHLRKAGLTVFGPGASGARLEGSKAFAKAAMVQAGVPTAAFESFTDPAHAADYAASRFAAGRQVAVKASGAALGKGVVLCESVEEAEEAIGATMIDREFGDAGATCVIEDRLFGKEFSLLCIAGGGKFVALPAAQDYKRALDGDRGPNTGGMGSVSPPSWLSPTIVEEAERSVIAPILGWLEASGIEFCGVLFAGLLVEDGKPYCLEYNVRFGDPETQSLVRLLSAGFADSLLAAARGSSPTKVEQIGGAAASVVVASEGYPSKPQTGRPIEIGELPEGVIAFHAGTKRDESEQLVSSGGRVLTISATGADLREAVERAYAGVRKVQLSGSRYRSDIGELALEGTT